MSAVPVWDYRQVRRWGTLSHEERCLMVNAQEHDLLAGVMWDWRTDLEFDDRLARRCELADVLVRLVDQGLVEVRRLWVDGDGDNRYEVVARGALSATLAEP